MSETRLQYMLGFYEFTQKSEKELLEYAIEGAGIVTGSTLGYLAFLNDDECELAMYAWSKNAMAECSMVTKPIVYKVEKDRALGRRLCGSGARLSRTIMLPQPGQEGISRGAPAHRPAHECPGH